MSLTADAEDAAYSAFQAAYSGDTGTGVNALNDNSKTTGVYNSTAYLIGGFFRRGDPLPALGSPTVPRIECEPVGFTEVDSPDHARVEGIVRMHVLSEGGTPSGFASQQAVALRVRQLYHRAALSSSGGWSFSTLYRKRAFQAPRSETEQHLIVEFAVVMSAGSGGGF